MDCNRLNLTVDVLELVVLEISVPLRASSTAVLHYATLHTSSQLIGVFLFDLQSEEKFVVVNEQASSQNAGVRAFEYPIPSVPCS